MPALFASIVPYASGLPTRYWGSGTRGFNEVTGKEGVRNGGGSLAAGRRGKGGVEIESVTSEKC